MIRRHASRPYYQLIRFIADLVLVRTRSDAQLSAEVLALRHQLRMLERSVGKPAWQPGDRLLLAALSRLLPRSGWSALLPTPESLLRWHCDLVRRGWAASRKCPPPAMSCPQSRGAGVDSAARPTESSLGVQAHPGRGAAA